MKKQTITLKALADEKRLRILKLLERGKMCVCELAFVLAVTQPSISRHLGKLKRAGLIGSKQNGFWTDYFIAKPDNAYGRTVLKNLVMWINDEDVIKADRVKARKAKRLTLCCRIKQSKEEA